VSQDILGCSGFLQRRHITDNSEFIFCFGKKFVAVWSRQNLFGKIGNWTVKSESTNGRFPCGGEKFENEVVGNIHLTKNGNRFNFATDSQIQLCEWYGNNYPGFPHVAIPILRLFPRPVWFLFSDDLNRMDSVWNFIKNDRLFCEVFQ